MRDLALLAIVAGFCVLALRRPWLGVVGLALFAAMHPQFYASGWMADFPAYKLLFGVTVVSLVFACVRERRLPLWSWSWPLLLLGLLCLHFALTTWFALLPDTARDRLLEFLLLLPPLLLTYWLADSREKLQYLVVATAGGIALLALKGGYWALMTGFSDRVYGPPGSQIGGNNEFAVALAMTIPLLVLWRRRSAGRALRAALGAVIALCYVAAISSWSRGGLVALAVMSALLVWHSRHKVLAAGLVAVGVAVALVQMPEQWQARMGTIASYAEDQSFQARQDAWQRGLEWVQRDLWTGSGFEGWRAVTASFSARGDYGARDWHSAYVEVLVEHGIPGLVLWLALLLGTALALTRMIGRGRRAGDPWQVDHGALFRASLAAYAVGGLTLGISYWELYFQLLAYAWIAMRLGAGASPVVSRVQPEPES